MTHLTPHSPLVKICGIRSVQDALVASEAGADWIGLNFHAGSIRRVDLDIAREVVEALPASCEAVGLFVDRPAVEVAALAEWLDIEIIQLHGSEPVEELAYLAGFRVVKAFRIGQLTDLDVMENYVYRAAQFGQPLHAVLLDAFVQGQHGGTGQTIASELLSAVRERTALIPRWILAGGLTPENVAARVDQLSPWMVDVAGGVELAPGQKDPARINAFVAAAKSRGA